MNEKMRYWLDQLVLVLVLIDPLGGIGILLGRQVELGLWMVFVVQLLFLAYTYNHAKTMGSMMSSVLLQRDLNKKTSLLENGPMIFCMTFGLAVFGKMMPLMLYTYKEFSLFDMVVWAVVMGYLVWRFFQTEFCRDISGTKEMPPVYLRLPYLTAVMAAANFLRVPFPWSSSTQALMIWGMALADMMIFSLLPRLRRR